MIIRLFFLLHAAVAVLGLVVATAPLLAGLFAVHAVLGVGFALAGLTPSQE